FSDPDPDGFGGGKRTPMERTRFLKCLRLAECMHLLADLGDQSDFPVLKTYEESELKGLGPTNRGLAEIAAETRKKIEVRLTQDGKSSTSQGSEKDSGKSSQIDQDPQNDDKTFIWTLLLAVVVLVFLISIVIRRVKRKNSS
ncbi:MAG: hypothetical protein HKN23_08665, partial [Verrucomicrobiales bacterium]|nr:hypothetical protein [Verrucomicrobiales bacterium]